MPVFPFGFNLSQKSAAEKALTEQISVIEGPPGTGKTQTILNIIANAIINEKTIAVVSNNNAATANVLEKLQTYGADFIAAYLGNTENKEKFFAGQMQDYPDMADWVMDSDSFNAVNDTLKSSGKELEEMLEAKNEAAVLKQELSSLLTEREYFYTYYNETNEEIAPYRSLYRLNSGAVMELWLNYQRIANEDKVITLKHKLLNLLRYGIFSFSFYQNSNEKIIACFQKFYYESRVNELTKQIAALETRLESYQFERSIEEYTQNSLKLFKAKLAARYSQQKSRKVFTKKSLWRDFASFIGEYPVVLSTTHSLRTCAGDNYLFDYVIMDEASQG
nr:AAA domain-containing protein [Phosphitispora fastidiosa]